MTYYIVFEPDVPPRVLFLENIVSWSVLYSLYTSFILATLIWCTTLIIYRILRVGGAAGRIHVYQRVIEILVESTFLYSAVLVVLVVLEARNELAGGYVRELAITIRVRLTRFVFFSCNDYNVSSRELCQQFWSAALQQGMLAQTTPGAIIPRRRQFGSEINQVRRMIVK